MNWDHKGYMSFVFDLGWCGVWIDCRHDTPLEFQKVHLDAPSIGDPCEGCCVQVRIFLQIWNYMELSLSPSMMPPVELTICEPQCRASVFEPIVVIYQSQASTSRTAKISSYFWSTQPNSNHANYSLRSCKRPIPLPAMFQFMEDPTLVHRPQFPLP